LLFLKYEFFPIDLWFGRVLFIRLVPLNEKSFFSVISKIYLFFIEGTRLGYLLKQAAY
jgi:hypothetical protein